MCKASIPNVISADDIYSVIKRIHSGVEVLEQEEGGNDDEDQEESVVIKDGEGGGLVVCDLVLLPQDPRQTQEKKHRVSVTFHGPVKMQYSMCVGSITENPSLTLNQQTFIL